MRPSIGRFLPILILLGLNIPLAFAQAPRKPLTDRELMALVAGNALNENIVHEIESRGLAFRPSNGYFSLVTQAGGDARVLAVLGKVKPDEGATSAGSDASVQLLQHLSTAGQF